MTAKKDYALTVAIPTYNRAKILQANLAHLCGMVDFKLVEVLVSDNASNDDTEIVVSELKTLYPEIKYVRNEHNLGFDGNFLNCFNRANGRYVWLLSDDDILLEGAVESVLEALKKNPVCMHLNSSTLVNNNPLRYKTPRYNNIGLLEYTDKNVYLQEIGIFCTFLSSLVFRTEYVQQIPNKEQYFSTNILQSHILFETMVNEGVYLINTYNCLAERTNNTIGYDLYKTWIKNYSDLILLTGKKCGFDKNLLDKQLHKDLKETIYSFVIHFRCTCKKEKEWDRGCIWKYIDRYPDLKLKYRIAINCPVRLLFVLHLSNKICRRIRKIKKGI